MPSPRRTRCFTYGETRRGGFFLPGGIHVSTATYKTACGRWDQEDVTDAPLMSARRPPGTCPRCWADWRREHARAITAEELTP